jgi:hypothetical protein
MSEELKVFEYVLHFVIEADSKEESLKEFVNAFGLAILDNCDAYEVHEG